MFCYFFVASAAKKLNFRGVGASSPGLGLGGPSLSKSFRRGCASSRLDHGLRVTLFLCFGPAVVALVAHPLVQVLLFAEGPPDSPVKLRISKVGCTRYPEVWLGRKRTSREEGRGESKDREERSKQGGGRAERRFQLMVLGEGL